MAAGMLKKLGYGLVAVAFIAGSMALAQNPKLQGHAQQLLRFMRANPWQGAALHCVLSVGITASGIPFSLVDLAVGAVYPFHIAVLMLFVAKTLGSTCCFLIATSVLPASTKASLLSNATIMRVNKLLGSAPLYYGTLARLAMMPVVVKNYGLALLDIQLTTYMGCCMIGSLVFVPLQAYMGQTMGAVALGLAQEAQAADPTLAAVGALVGVGALVLVSRGVVPALLAKGEKEQAAAVGSGDVPADNLAAVMTPSPRPLEKKKKA